MGSNGDGQRGRVEISLSRCLCRSIIQSEKAVFMKGCSLVKSLFSELQKSLFLGGLTILSCGFLLTAVSGCGHKVKIPKTFPCSVEVIQNGAPAEGMVISFYPESGSSQFGIGGDTGTDGQAEMGTTFGTDRKTGVPKGSYKVVVSYTVTVQEEKTPEELATMTMEEAVAYGQKMAEKFNQIESAVYVPESVQSKETTPIQFSVTGSDSDILKIDLDQYE